MDGAYVGALAVLLGHLFPVFFGFRGGKGVLTSAGVMLVVNPVVFAILVPIIVALMLITRIVSLGSITAAVLYPFLTYFVVNAQGRPALLETLLAGLMAVLVIYMHRSNIKRLLNGTESRFGKKKAEAPKED
jgi:glycerol-3-phosphate acyltransferase PlsY